MKNLEHLVTIIVLVAIIALVSTCISIEYQCTKYGVAQLLYDRYYCIPDRELPKNFDHKELLRPK